MQGERFCNNCYKIAPCFGEKYNSDDHRLAADIDLPIGDGQIAAQLILYTPSASATDTRPPQPDRSNTPVRSPAGDL